MEHPQLHIIGMLHGDIASRDDAPKNYSESNRVGTIEVFSQYTEGSILGAEQHSVTDTWRQP